MPTRFGFFLDRKSPAARIREISDQYSLEVNPDSYIRDLPVGVQQRVRGHDLEAVGVAAEEDWAQLASRGAQVSKSWQG